MVSAVVSSTSFPVPVCYNFVTSWRSRNSLFIRRTISVSASQPVVPFDSFSSWWNSNSEFVRSIVSVSARQLVVPFDSFSSWWSSNSEFVRCNMSISASQPVAPFDSFSSCLQPSVEFRLCALKHATASSFPFSSTHHSWAFSGIIRLHTINRDETESLYNLRNNNETM